MDDIEDDARYPLNPQNHRPKLPIHPQFSRRFTEIKAEADDDDEEEDVDSEDININNKIDHHQHHLTMDYFEDEPDTPDSDDIIVNDNVEGGGGEGDDDNDDSSLESRGKRRKLDKFALGFEFVPRKPQLPPPTAILPNSKAPLKNSPPDWSEDSTFVLLEAWGDLYVQNGRKSLRSDEWSEVSKIVNQDSRITRSDSQCRNRLDTLKKKYKKEKARLAENVNPKSDWVYFKKMDSLMLPLLPPPEIQTDVVAVSSKSSPVRLACGVDAGEYVFSSSRVYMNRANGMDEMRDSPGNTGTDDDEDGRGEEEEEDESDGLPPMAREKKGRGRSGDSLPSFRMLADSIQKFGDVYEKIESSKRQQMAELERMRKEFHRDLEAQKRQILERAQTEIARMSREEGEGEDEEEEHIDEEEEDEIDGSAENLSV